MCSLVLGINFINSRNSQAFAKLLKSRNTRAIGNIQYTSPRRQRQIHPPHPLPPPPIAMTSKGKSRWEEEDEDPAELESRRLEKEAKKKAKAEKERRKAAEAEEKQRRAEQDAADESQVQQQHGGAGGQPPPKRRKLDEDGLGADGDGGGGSGTQVPPIKLLRIPAPEITSCRHVDHYELLNHIEEGSYGIVSRAKDTATGEIVALKRLKLERERDGFPITSLREIQTLIACRHPNVVNIREVVMGDRLDQYVVSFRLLPPPPS